MNELVMRAKLAHYMECGTPLAYCLMGEGITDLTESKNAKTYSRTYVHQNTESSDVIGYAPSLGYSADVYSENPVAARLVAATDKEQIGSAARVNIVEVHLWEPVSANIYKAIKRQYAIVPDGKGSGTEALVYTGSINAIGDSMEGTFDTSNNTFNATAAGTLSFDCSAGANVGETQIGTVTPALTSGNSYVYRVSANAIVLPNAGDVVDHTYTAWDGTAAITAANSDNLALAEIDNESKCVKAGTATVVSN